MTTELTFLSRVAYRGREISGPRLRGLLALLADDLRTGCSAARLVDGLWPDHEQPENPTKALQVLVSRTRAQLGPDTVALAHAEAGLALWDGPPGSDGSGDPVAALRTARAATYATLVRARAQPRGRAEGRALRAARLGHRGRGRRRPSVARWR
ncbi:hypothetical protein [Streptomyces avermitilis]|uniref:hypothetical protein n=1 Tax=Streptomyces avermitilis TaxID=33903 RepID=UPI003F4B2164